MNIPTKDKPFKFLLTGKPLSWNATNKFKVAERRQGKKIIRFVEAYPSPESIAYKRKVKITIKKILKEWEKENGKWDKEKTKEGVWILKINYFLHRRDGDATNYQKMIVDSVVQSGLLNDDNNIVLGEGILVYDPENPRLYVSLYKSEQDGVWPSEAHKNKWVKQNCSNCKKGKRCAQFTKFTKGTITGMDEKWKCKSFIEK